MMRVAMRFDTSCVPEMYEWLLGAPHVSDGGQSFVRDLATSLRERGLPLWRISFSLLAKHPEVLWRTVRWHETEGVTVVGRAHELAREASFKDSPVALLVSGAAPIRVRLNGSDLRFPVCRELAEQGGTDYYAQGLNFSNGEVSYIAWATREPGGFADDAVQALDELAPMLARRIELESSYYATRSLLEVYLGKNAAQRVVNGQFRRGGGELISAAIWFCDLRGFTSISDRTSPTKVVEILDTYFDCVAGVIAKHGGEVLKFIGDAILAIFPVAADAGDACQRALAAAEQALSSLEEVNQSRAGEAQLNIGVALHLGEVMYGNIGSRERLDFTVISSSVNETSRLEGLCKTLGTRLTLSQAFVNVIARSDIVDLGEYDLKGVSSKRRVFTLARFRPT
ncbi:MAG TPA: adenylate/guanylate cyclase domain-containing protein [Polyangiaceae bacterium]|nr:adenylate/guanylate cyclase domain-containing protein [Polyangiaceae bacterium]